MKIWRVHQLGEPLDVMHLEEADDPTAKPGEVVLDVDACGLNFPDLLQIRGGYQVKPPLPYTPGGEIAGTVRSVGAGVDSAVLRAACHHAIGALLASAPDQIAVLGSAPTSRAHSPLAQGTLAGFGVPVEVHLGSPSCGGADELPLSITIGAWLLAQSAGPRTGAVGFSVGSDFAGTRAAGDLLGLAAASRLGLLVMGDGSARRSLKAPGYLDPRAVPFDDDIAAALRSGDGDALAALDPVLGAELLAAGVPAWRAAGAVLGGTYAAMLTYAEAPYGVGYFVAHWDVLRLDSA